MATGENLTSNKTDKDTSGNRAKKIDNLLAKSENYWNKIPHDYKEILTKTLKVELVIATEKDYKEEWKNKMLSLSVGEFLGPMPHEFFEGTAFVNIADPTNLCYWPKNQKMQKINLTILYDTIVEKQKAEKNNLLSFYKTILAEKVELTVKNDYDLESEMEENIAKEYFKEKVFEDTYLIQNKLLDSENTSDIYGGREAWKRLETIGIDKDIDQDCTFLIAQNNIFLFIIFPDKYLAEIWIFAFRLLLRSQDLSYRGAKDENTGKKKEFFKEFRTRKEIRSEHKSHEIITYIFDVEYTSKCFRTLKIIFWSREKEFFKLIICDMRDNYEEFKEKFDHAIEDELCVNKEIFSCIFFYVEVSKFFLILQEKFDFNSESKNMSLLKSNEDINRKLAEIKREEEEEKVEKEVVGKEKKNKERAEEGKNSKEIAELKVYDLFLMPSDRGFWRKRRKTMNTFKGKLLKRGIDWKARWRKPKPSETIDEVILQRIHTDIKLEEVYRDIESDLKFDDNKMLHYFKVLQLQKQAIILNTIELILNNKKKKKKRNKMGAKFREKSLAFQIKKSNKKIEKDTANVLKLLMFENLRPGLVPENLKKKIHHQSDSRDCCLTF